MTVLEQFRLDGKTALVTGARRGIGRAIAAGLAEAGADIIAVSANLESAGSALEGDVTALGRRFAGYRCDFSRRGDVYEFIDALTKAHPVIDILVNNAGTVLREPAERHPDEYWDRILEINLSAQFLLSREIGKGMLARGRGKIIFIASLLTFQGGITVPGYAASKGGVGQHGRHMPPGSLDQQRRALDQLVQLQVRRRIVQRNAEQDVACRGDGGLHAETARDGAGQTVGAPMAAEQRRNGASVLGDGNHRRLAPLVGQQGGQTANRDAGSHDCDNRLPGPEPVPERIQGQGLEAETFGKRCAARAQHDSDRHRHASPRL